MTGLPRDLGEDLQVHETLYDLIGSRERSSDQRADILHAHDRLLVELLQHAVSVAGGAAKVFGDAFAMLLTELENPARGVGGLHAHLRDAAQEKREPCLKVAYVPHCLKPLVVLLPMTLEVVGQVEDRLLQRAALAQQKRDEEPTDAAVAVEKRMDGLELRMRQTDLHEQRQVVLLVKKRLECAERRRHLRGRRRNDVASASVQPPGPIQFWLRRSSPGVSREPRTPLSSSA